jgi:hypothetical protein
MIADRNLKVIHYFDPLHLRRPVFKGNPTGAVHKLKCYISEYSKNDPLCSFSDIQDYQTILAHENPAFNDRLPLQLKGNGCAIHCISFSVYLMSGHHATLTYAQTEPLRKVLRALINTSSPFGTGRSYRQEWEARAAEKAAAQEQMEMDKPQEAMTGETDQVLMVEEADKEPITRAAILEHIDEMEIGGYSEPQSSTMSRPSSPVDTTKPATQSKVVAQVSKTVATAQESSDEMELDGDVGAPSNSTGHTEEGTSSQTSGTSSRKQRRQAKAKGTQKRKRAAAADYF